MTLDALICVCLAQKFVLTKICHVKPNSIRGKMCFFVWKLIVMLLCYEFDLHQGRDIKKIVLVPSSLLVNLNKNLNLKQQICHLRYIIVVPIVC